MEFQIAKDTQYYYNSRRLLKPAGPQLALFELAKNMSAVSRCPFSANLNKGDKKACLLPFLTKKVLFLKKFSFNSCQKHKSNNLATLPRL